MKRKDRKMKKKKKKKKKLEKFAREYKTKDKSKNHVNDRAKVWNTFNLLCFQQKMIMKKKPTGREENKTWEGSLFEGSNRLGNIATFHCDFPPAPISCNLILCQS
jgi:hypothetical protein